MSEDSMWDAIRPVLSSLDPVRVENPVGPGTPDVNYTGGWIELKFADRWPPRGGPLRLEHYTKQQRVWHQKRRRAGGRVFVLLKVDVEWLLIDGVKAAITLGDATREELYQICTCRWKRLPKTEEICPWLLS
jgi:hypothetical protein